MRLVGAGTSPSCSLSAEAESSCSSTSSFERSDAWQSPSSVTPLGQRDLACYESPLTHCYSHNFPSRPRVLLSLSVAVYSLSDLTL
jgi:hypothetical protein